MDASCPITTAPGLAQRRIRLPSFSLTAVLLLVIGAVFCSPAATAWLEFDRSAVAAGQWCVLRFLAVEGWRRPVRAGP